MDDNPINSGIDGLQALISRAGKFSRGPAPVDKWEPDYCGGKKKLR